MSNTMRVIAGLTALAACASLQAQNVAAGKGNMREMPPADAAPGTPFKDVEFAPKHAYAFATGEGEQRRIHVTLTEKEPPRALWDEAADRSEAIHAWCGAGQSAYVTFDFKPSGEADGLRSCDRNAGSSSAGVSSMNGLASIVATLDTNDGKRLKGKVETGDGACGTNDEPPKWCTQTASYTFDAALAPPALPERVWSTGKAEGPEVAAASKALLAYWAAAGKAASIDDVRAHFSAERTAQVDQQMKQAGEFAQRMFTNVFVPAHATPPQIGAARALADAAVIETTNPVTRRDTTRTQTCRVLMRQQGGAWKVDKESCTSK